MAGNPTPAALIHLCVRSWALYRLHRTVPPLAFFNGYPWFAGSTWYFILFIVVCRGCRCTLCLSLWNGRWCYWLFMYLHNVALVFLLHICELNILSTILSTIILSRRYEFYCVSLHYTNNLLKTNVVDSYSVWLRKCPGSVVVAWATTVELLIHFQCHSYCRDGLVLWKMDFLWNALMFMFTCRIVMPWQGRGFSVEFILAMAVIIKWIQERLCGFEDSDQLTDLKKS